MKLASAKESSYFGVAATICNAENVVKLFEPKVGKVGTFISQLW